jgi:hypothetical protein
MAGANSLCRSPSLPRQRAAPEALTQISELSPRIIRRLAKLRFALYRTTYRKI